MDRRRVIPISWPVLGHGRVAARQTIYADGGQAVASTSAFRSDGSRQVDVGTGDQTLASSFFDTFANHEAPDNTFVFSAGFGLDVIHQFRLDGTDHDTLSLPGSDFGNAIADVLRNTRSTKQGAVITDPTSRDTIRLAGITKAELKANKDDFAFHA